MENHMEHLILQLRKALVSYEECVDVCAAEHITANALLNLTNKCNDVARFSGDMIERMLQED